MKTRIICVATMLMLAFSCQNEDDSMLDNDVSGDVLNEISLLGFSTEKVKRLPEGYLVEGDIILTKNDFARATRRKTLRIAETEQYHTTNLVSGLPREITVSVASNLPASYVNYTDAAMARYNAMGLNITFRRVRTGADIQIIKASFFEQYYFLASAGFPSATGDPFHRIKVSNNQLNGQPAGTIVSVLAHEIGHCIGFRHTDYMDRSYSCGGSAVDEGAGSIGAVHIPGTPTTPDANSWMLSCIGAGDDRPFNANDQLALNYLY